MRASLNNIYYSLPIIFILTITLLLQVYIGYGEAHRKYAQFEVSKLASQGETLVNISKSHLQAGLPLKQFSGFYEASKSLLSDPGIENIQIINSQNDVLWTFPQRTDTPHPLEETISKRKYKPSKLHQDEENEKYELKESKETYKVSLPLKNKTGTVGYINLESRKDYISNTPNNNFNIVFYVFFIVILFFILFIFIYEIYLSHILSRKLAQKIAFTLSFFIMSSVISVAVFDIYKEGAVAKAKALSSSMAHRLNAILNLGIDLRDIEGINDALREYQANNPEINSIAITNSNNKALYHTDKQLVNELYEKPGDSYLFPESLGQDNKLKVSLTTPQSIVFDAVLDTSKDFLILFIATGLIALIFMDSGTQLVTAVMRRKRLRQNLDQHSTQRPTRASPEKNVSGEQDFEIALSLVKPAYFIIVFVNGLPISFIPQLVTYLADKAVTLHQIASASLPFTIYYLMFALVLIPAGHYAEKGVSLKKIMAIGFVAEAIGAFLIATTNASDYWLFTSGRLFSGIGQGIFLIGLQSYILTVSPKGQRTQGAAIKVVCKNAGQIAGTAIGALLFVYIEYQVLFLFASLLSLLGIIYLHTLLPSESHVANVAPRPNQSNKDKPGIRKSVALAIRDAEFTRTLLFIGIPGKMNITGVAMFAVPLILDKIKLTTADIGQALMIYYLSLIIMTSYASKWVDRLNATRGVLFASAIIGGIGMTLFGIVTFSGTQNTETEHQFAYASINNLAAIASQINNGLLSLGIDNISIYVTLACLLLLGIANGLSLAPLTTHISKTNVAEKYGAKSVTATYTFLERSGHVLGPIVIVQLFILTNQSALAVSVFGLITLFFGFVFFISSRKQTDTHYQMVEKNS